jgi:6-pyruvoyltetrahydropterin/6-carboxytetrahydropterin synthase
MTAMNKTVTICRKIVFSCGHRYYRADLTDEENRELYGSSYSEHGHGNNYVLKAYVEGRIDPETGMVMNLRDLDSVLKEVTRPLDHHFLNYDVPFFAEVVPTTENIAAYCFQEISRQLTWDHVKLKRVRIQEGQALWVDCDEGPEIGSRI